MQAKLSKSLPDVPYPVVGLIGCGHIGRFHSRNIRGAIRSELVPAQYAATCDLDLERARAFADIVGADVATSDAQTLLADPRLNAVYICTETSAHPALVEAAVERGLAIFCEKPLAMSIEAVRRMAALTRDAGVVNQVGLVLRYSPVYTVLADLMSNHDLGPLLTAHMRDDQVFPIEGHYRSTWRGDPARTGGGTLVEHSIHDVDVFHWLFGPIERVRCHTRVTTGHDGIEDVAMATFQHEGGHQTTLSSIWHAVESRRLTRRLLEVFFERGWFWTEHDFLGPIRYALAEGPEVELTSEEVLDRYVSLAGLSELEADLARQGMLEDVRFLQAVADGRPAFPDFAVALRAHEVVAACYRSAAEGAELPVP